MPHIVNITEIEYVETVAEGVIDERPTILTFGVEDNISKEYIESEFLGHIKEYTGHEVKSFRYDFTYTENLED
jgi:hypothetical protein